MSNTCEICNSETQALYDPQLDLYYDVCDHCGFVYKQAQYHVNEKEEKATYDQHENSFESPGYVNMFEKFIDEAITPVDEMKTGLDFGSGPGPVLYELLKQKGYTMTHFDPFFHPDMSYQTETFDFITTTEVAEHFAHPVDEFAHLISLLRPGGYLFVMTQFNKNDNDEFLTWWYRRDNTHISFYRLKTFKYLAEKLGVKITHHNDKNIIVFRK